MPEIKIETFNGELILPLKKISKELNLKEEDSVKISLIQDKDKKYFILKKE